MANWGTLHTQAYKQALADVSLDKLTKQAVSTHPTRQLSARVVLGVGQPWQPYGEGCLYHPSALGLRGSPAPARQGRCNSASLPARSQPPPHQPHALSTLHLACGLPPAGLWVHRLQDGCELALWLAAVKAISSTSSLSPLSFSEDQREGGGTEGKGGKGWGRADRQGSCQGRAAHYFLPGSVTGMLAMYWASPASGDTPGPPHP